MKKAIRAFYQSFYSKSLYRDAAHAWEGTGIGVLAGVILLGMVLLTPISLMGVNWSTYTTIKESVIGQMPAVTVEHGVLSIDRPTPYYITTLDKSVIALFDTSEAAEQMSIDDIVKRMKEENTRVFVGRKFALHIKNGTEYRVYDYGELEQENTLRFDKNDIAAWAKKLEIISIPLFMLGMYGSLLLYAIIQMLLYSVAALAWNALLGAKLSYAALQRITVCALIPESLLASTFNILGSDVPFFICVAIVLGYLGFGVRAAKN